MKVKCEFCSYNWPDLDSDGVPLSIPYCHFPSDYDWLAPCEEEDFSDDPSIWED